MATYYVSFKVSLDDEMTRTEMQNDLLHHWGAQDLRIAEPTSPGETPEWARLYLEAQRRGVSPWDLFHVDTNLVEGNMPVMVTQRCQNCHQLKERAADFPFTRLEGTIAQRVYGPYCKACLKEHPALWNDMGAQPDKSELENERDPAPTDEV